jgi:hypothetical protein
MSHFTKLLSVLAFSLLFMLSPAAVGAQESTVLVTSSGQALDAFTIKTLLTRAKVANTYDPVATADQLAGIKTLVIAFGASIKGFGAAGITAETELARTSALIEAAKSAGIRIVGVHIGGMERRLGLSEQFVQLVSGAADALVVYQPGDEDGFFTRIAGERGIEITFVEQPMKAGEAVIGYLAP